jgi:trk system potassium uptake protein TrkH
MSATMVLKKWASPFLYPVYFFAAVIAAGALLLHQEFCLAQGPISWIDALFTATSATCVTGLIVVDTGTFFSHAGQAVILGLIQLGGLGIMTYTSLVFYLWRRRVSLVDRVAVGQSLLHEPAFDLGRFLIQVAGMVFLLEATGCIMLYLLGGNSASLFWSLFHAVSAFCNAGFSLQADSLVPWQDDIVLNAVFIALIVTGGLGFSVILELVRMARGGHERALLRQRLSWHTRIVFKTSGVLIVFGAVALYASEALFQGPGGSGGMLTALFQSVTARTAGFNTVDIGSMANTSLLVLIFLMFIGGSPGSCAGGVKTTTLAALWAFAMAQIKGRNQAVAGRFALDQKTMNKALTLALFAALIVVLAVLALSVTENMAGSGEQARGMFLDILFEVVSAFGTVGLSTGLTPELSNAGKLVVSLVMFVGRLGPIVFLSALVEFQRRESFSWPEDSLLIG